MVKDVVVARNVTAVFNLIDQSILNITNLLTTMVPPNNQCVNALLKLTCSKCQKSIPSLCRNVCGAVVKGCYAPYVAVLNPQFDILWNVSYQLGQLLNTSLADLFAQQSVIRMALITGLQAGCGITVPSNVTSVKPQGLSNMFLKKLQMLPNTGLLSYDPIYGPMFCNSSSVTARSNCWNGTAQVAQDIPLFNATTIAGQAMNPVSPFDEVQLAQQANSIGTPISNLLSNPDVMAAVAGAAVTIPQGQTYPTSATNAPTNGSIGTPAVSLSALLLLFLINALNF